MLNLLCAEAGGSSWPMLLIIGALFIVMMLITIIPQRKRKKEAQQMMQSVRVGKKIRTIGGFVGEIVSLDNKNNTMELNVGTKEAPVIVLMDQGAIGTVLNPDAPQQAAPAQEKTADTTVAPDAVTANDAAEDAVVAEKAAEKKAKKDAKKKEKAEKKAAEQESQADEVVTENVETAETTSEVDADSFNSEVSH